MMTFYITVTQFLPDMFIQNNQVFNLNVNFRKMAKSIFHNNSHTLTP